MTTAATRSHVRHAGDAEPDALAEREAKQAERNAELAARQDALRKSNPELAAWADAKVRRR